MYIGRENLHKKNQIFHNHTRTIIILNSSRENPVSSISIYIYKVLYSILVGEKNNELLTTNFVNTSPGRHFLLTYCID